MSKIDSSNPKSAAPTLVTFAQKSHRDIDEISAELATARKRFEELEPKNRDYYAKRSRAVDRRKLLEAKHKREAPDHPFDAEMYTPPAHVPPEDSQVGREFHRLHLTMASLRAELEAAKTAMVNL